MKKLIPIAVTAILILGLLVVWPGLWWPIAKTANPEISFGEPADRSAEGWQTYVNDRYGYQVQCPPGFEVIDNGNSPVQSGALSEIVVEKRAPGGKPDVFLTLDIIENFNALSLGGVDFKLDGRDGSIGCDFGRKCTAYLPSKNAIIEVKSSYNPAEMINADSKKILSTLVFFEDEKIAIPEIDEILCRSFVCEWKREEGSFAGPQTGILLKDGARLAKISENRYRMTGVYSVLGNEQADGSFSITFIRQGGSWTVLENSFE